MANLWFDLKKTPKNRKEEKNRRKRKQKSLLLQNSLNELSSCHYNNFYCIMFEISLCSTLALIHLDSERVLAPAYQIVAVIKYFLPFCEELYRIREKEEVQLTRASWCFIAQVLFVCFSISQFVLDFTDKRLILLLFWHNLFCLLHTTRWFKWSTSERYLGEKNLVFCFILFRL